jgi:hypothetical protein
MEKALLGSADQGGLLPYGVEAARDQARRLSESRRGYGLDRLAAS